MAYATSASISDRYGANYLVDVSDRDDDDVSDAGAVIEAIEDTASEMDAYIEKRYPLPLAKVPAWCVRCNVDMAVYELASEGRIALTDEMSRKYIKWTGDGDEIKGFLEKLADGEVGLGLGVDEPDTTSEPEFYADDLVMQVSQTRGLA